MNLDNIKKNNLEIDKRFLLVVDEYIKKNNVKGILFQDLWLGVLNDEQLNRLLKNGIDEFQHKEYEYLLSLFIKFFYQNKISFSPEIDSNKNLLPGNLLVMTHSGFPLIKHIASYSNLIAIMTDYPNEVKRLSRNIDSSKIITFPRDKFSLLTIKNLLAKNILTVCTIDFRSSVPGIYDSISDSIFKFAHKCSIPIYFGTYQVTPQGTLQFINNGPFINKSNALIEEFLAFQKMFRPHVQYSLKIFDHEAQTAKILNRFKN